MNWELNTKIKRFVKNTTEIMEVVGSHKSSTDIDYYILEAESGKCFLYTVDFCHENYKQIIKLTWVKEGTTYKTTYKGASIEIRCDFENEEFNVAGYINNHFFHKMNGISAHNFKMMKHQIEEFLASNSSNNNISNTIILIKGQ